MKSKICEILDIEFPLLAFSHCKDVVAQVSKAGGMGVLCRARDQCLQAARRQISRRQGRGGVHLRAEGWLRRRGEAGLAGRVVQPSRQYRRYPQPHHPSGIDHAQPAGRRGAGRSRGRTGRGSAVDRYRAYRRYHRRP